MIARIFLTEKGFCVPVKLRNNLEVFTINSLVNMKEKGFLFIDYQFIKNLKDKMNISIMTLPKSKKYGIFNGKKTCSIIYAIYLFIKMGDHYIQINAFYVMKIAKHFIIIEKKWLKQYGVLLDAITISIMFRSGFC